MVIKKRLFFIAIISGLFLGNLSVKGFETAHRQISKRLLQVGFRTDNLSSILRKGRDELWQSSDQ